MATQTTAPIRPGHRQGFFIQVFNFTGMTQTVLGSNLGGSGPDGGTDAKVTLSTSDPERSGSEPHTLSYALPVSIPPGQSRHLRITWTSRGCVTQADVGGHGLSGIARPGRLGHPTEYIAFGQGFYLGPGGRCRI